MTQPAVSPTSPGVGGAHPLHPSRTGRVSGLLPEMELVLASVRDEPDTFQATLARLGPSLHWPLLVALSEREMATPILHRRLRRAESGAGGATPERMAHLGRLAMVHEFRLMEMERRLNALLSTYESEGIRILLLKGAALWHSAYRKPARRPMGDVDLLVEEGRAEEAWELARVQGWGQVVDWVPMEAFEEHQHMARLYDESGLGLGLEIHTDIFPERNPFRFPTAELWSHAEPLPGRNHVHVPTSRHLLLHNCLHFAWSHAFGYGTWKAMRDTNALLRRGDVDLDRFVAEAHQQRAASCAFWTLHLASEWSGVEVDPEVLRGLGRPVPRPAVTVLRRHLATALTTPAEYGLPVRLSHRMWEAAVRPEPSGHGDIRPWSGDEKWEMAATDPDTPGSPPEPSGFDRGRATLRHLVRLISGR